MQVDPLERAVLLGQGLDALKLFPAHSGISDEQDAPVNVCPVHKRSPDIASCNMGKISHFQAADYHFALSKHNDGMEQ